MKKLTSFILFFGVCIAVHGQDNKKSDTSDNSQIVFKYIGNTHKNKSNDGLGKNVPIEIPNAYQRNDYAILSNMPIRSLSGKNLAPMPGTEPLDSIVNRDTATTYNRIKSLTIDMPNVFQKKLK